ncbi:hypothetical protein [Microbispora sp. H11081]|uniref:hypothetical protein n=1 Tax=Microbispora sp. H11081 TaxID=2729107 RepID=UPI001474C47D|nr:hypothetical protein [Microbispora sp. H11081]
MGQPPYPPNQPYGHPQQPYQPQPPYQGQPYQPQPSYQGQPPYQPQQPPMPRKSVTKHRGLSAKSHTFHLLATIFTCGLWGLFVWLPLWVFRLFVRRKQVTKHYY